MGKEVLLRGPILTNSGYGVHTRQIAKWLFRDIGPKLGLNISTEPLPWGRTHWLLNPDLEDGLVGEVMQVAGNKKNFYDVTIQVQLPNEWNPYLGSFNVGVTAGVEANKCNPAWIDNINKMDLVIVPSEFTKRVFLDSGDVKTPIIVVPEAYPEVFDEPSDGQQLELNLSTKFNFLVVGQITGTNVDNDRKNIPYMIKWLAEVFDGQPDVGVVIKTNSGTNTELDKRNVQSIFAKLIGEVSKPTGPKFYLLHGHMSDKEMKGLYTHPDIKALVSLTHGEGYGLPILEAAACNLPVIVTDWSGHLEFLKEGKYIGVDYIMGEVHESRVDNQIFMSGVKWAYPTESDSKRRLAKFRQSSVMPKAWAVELGSKIREKYNLKSVAERYTAALGDALKD